MDKILINGIIETMDNKYSKVQAIAIKNGKIEAVGDNEEILKLKDRDAEIIDLKGRMVLPGFNDSHMHLLNYGITLMKADLVGSKSIDEIIERVKSFAERKTLKSGDWILGRGWNHDYFDKKRFPTRYDLDRISTTYPICITRACGHVSIVNSKALEIAGITKDTPLVEGGHFDRDEYGEPLGIFRENALSLIYDILPKPDINQLKSMILEASKRALSEGITSIQTDDLEAITDYDFENVIKAYRELESEGKLLVRINQQCLLPSIKKLNRFLNIGYRTGQGSDLFKIGPLKLLVDGSLGARTALMCNPYADDPSTSGIKVYTQEELDNLVITAHNAGMQVAIHCIGDKAMYMAFESFEKAQKQNPRDDARHSIVHCQITDETLLDKFKELKVIAHIQPIFLDYDLHIVEDRIGKERAKTTYSWKSMLDKGVHIACGSDCPVEYFRVLNGIYCAVTRKDLKGYPETGWLKEQRLTVHEAIQGFTLGGAYTSFEENIKGSITPGKLADLVILSDNIYEISNDKIKDVKVEMTFLGGEVVYKA